MRFHKFILLFFAVSVGCYHYASVEVHLADAATGQPIVKKKVSCAYPKSHGAFRPKTSIATTNADGMAHLKICTNFKPPLAVIFFPGSGEVLDDPTPRLGLIVSTDAYKEHGPHRLEIRMLTWQEYQAKYGAAH